MTAGSTTIDAMWNFDEERVDRDPRDIARQLFSRLTGAHQYGNPVARREKIDFDEDCLPTPDYAEPITSVSELNYERERRDLIKLVNFLSEKGLEIDTDLVVKASSSSAEAASALLKQLPSKYVLPRISPDDDGGIAMIWEKDEQATILTIDGWKLHIVENPATPHSRHLPVTTFDGETVPQALEDTLITR